MMSALSVLYLVLPFPIVFLIHELEEIFVAPKWMQKKKAELEKQFPRAAALVGQLASLDRKGFSYAVLEELVIVLFCTFYVLEDANVGLYLWAAMVLAYSAHIAFHLVQAAACRSYVPGVVTAVLCIPFCAMAVKSIWLGMSGVAFALCLVLGTLFMLLNLMLAHKIGAFFSKK